MPSFYVENFGCRATQADGAAIEEQFRQRGLDRANDLASAEVVVLNTCAVTTWAERDARAAIRRVRRNNPGCEVIVTGCYAQRAPQEIAALPGVSCVVGNSHKHNLAQIILRAQSEKDNSGTKSFIPLAELAQKNVSTHSRDERIFVSDIFAHTTLLAAPVFDSANERTRPNLKIQDGCGNRCSFCIIPSLRGRSRSLKLEEVLREIGQLVAAGYREVVISGINLGRWGRDLAAESVWGVRPRPPILEELVHAILDHTSLEKLRISSIEPMDWSDSFIELVASSPRIAKHAHIPMQSGSDSVLRRMNRRYRPWHYREKIEKIRAAMPNAAIGADVMVGFPGETDSDFDQTRRMIEDLPFTYLHVFTFSTRPGTPAAGMPNQVPTGIARERNRILRELAAQKKSAFMQSFVGQTVEAITLNAGSGASRDPWTDALSDNYLKIRIHGTHAPNQWMPVNVTAFKDSELIASPMCCSTRIT
ncbi:MAG TPA: tRNA (N(6)-L-threonylcarbamoyladenosine(37)-C(2))-methylthiotransferase MtaB [Terriglobales bacterium]